MASQALKRIALVVFMLFSSAGMAQTAADSLAGCKAVKDNLARLSCYDNIPSGTTGTSGTSAQGASKYTAMTWDDFIIDMQSMAGKKVAIHGAITMWQPTSAKSLSKKYGDVSTVFLRLNNLSKEDQKRVVSKCLYGQSPVPAMCYGTFYITHDEMGSQTLDRVVWK